MTFDHIGVFVKTLESGRGYLGNILYISNWTIPVDDPIQRVSVQFGTDISGIRYELVAPFGENNPVDSLLKQAKNILNHVAYLVDNIESEIVRFQNEGCVLISPPSQAIAFGNKRVAFLYTPLRIIIELIEN